MAEIKLPIKIDGFKCVEDMAQTVLNYTYKGKTLKEWIDSISEPQTNGDRIRAMSDEELVQYIGHDLKPCPPPHYENHFEGCMVDDTFEELITNKECDKCWLEWLKKGKRERRMICIGCKYYDTEHTTCQNIKARYVGCDECFKWEKKKSTNADRIRSMSQLNGSYLLSNAMMDARALKSAAKKKKWVFAIQA